MAVRRSRQRWFWFALSVLVALILFLVAVSNAAYEATSPSWLSWHVLLRKGYSLAAFGLVGLLFAHTARAFDRPSGAVPVGLMVLSYSALIELGQRLISGAHESLEQQGFDVACGLIGGILGALAARAQKSAPRD